MKACCSVKSQCKAERFLARLEYQFDNAPITLRKALQFKEASRVHLATGLYLALLDKFSQVAPPSEFRHLKASLDTQFNAGYLDGELFHMADEQVPPIDLRSISAFRQGSTLNITYCTMFLGWPPG